MLELFRLRVTLCDLLVGRCMRWHAESLLSTALRLEVLQADPKHINDVLGEAALAEYFAVRAERAEVRWGNRYDREGRRHPED